VALRPDKAALGCCWSPPPWKGHISGQLQRRAWFAVDGSPQTGVYLDRQYGCCDKHILGPERRRGNDLCIWAKTSARQGRPGHSAEPEISLSRGAFSESPSTRQQKAPVHNGWCGGREAPMYSILQDLPSVSHGKQEFSIKCMYGHPALTGHANPKPTHHLRPGCMGASLFGATGSQVCETMNKCG
jgi:hypothetical protein